MCGGIKMLKRNQSRIKG